MNDTRESLLSPATQRRYHTHRLQFEQWRSERGLDLNEESAKAYILEQAPRVSKAWVLQARSAIGHFYGFANSCDCWECVCSRAHRLAIDKTETRKLSDEDVRRVLLDIDMIRRSAGTIVDDVQASRDACIISLIRANDLRVHQLLALNRSDFNGIGKIEQSCRLGNLVVKRRPSAPTLDPVPRLEDWCRYVDDGPLFRKIERTARIGDKRLHHRSISHIVKKRCEPLGFAIETISPESFRKP